MVVTEVAQTEGTEDRTPIPQAAMRFARVLFGVPRVRAVVRLHQAPGPPSYLVDGDRMMGIYNYNTVSLRH